MNEKNKAKILAEFQKGKKLTVLDAWFLCATTELRVYVSQLRKDGYNILSQIVAGKRHKFYWLEA